MRHVKACVLWLWVMRGHVHVPRSSTDAVALVEPHPTREQGRMVLIRIHSNTFLHLLLVTGSTAA
jgi:hypothetical protein